MDAKSKANFINSIAGGDKIACPKCNSMNDIDSVFCQSCGFKIQDGQAEAASKESAAAFAAVKEPENVEEKTVPKQEEVSRPPVIERYVEEESVFAEGLPEWDVLPPQVMVRRKAKR